MNLAEFLTITNQSFTTKREYDKAILSWLTSPSCIAWLQAINRSSNSKARREIERLSKELWALLQLPPDDDQFIAQLFHDELRGMPNRYPMTYYRAKENGLHHRFALQENWVVMAKAHKLEQRLIALGEQCLESEMQELNQALLGRNGIDGTLLSFAQYHEALFTNGREKQDSTPTLQQLLAYCEYMRAYIEPFCRVDDHTENYRQAQRSLDAIKRVRHLLKTATEQERFMVQQSTELLHVIRRTASGAERDTLIEKHKQLNAQILTQAYELIDGSGNVRTDHEEIKKLLTTFNYWQHNAKGIHQRRVLIAQLAEAAITLAGSGKTVKIYRFVSEAEKDAIQQGHCFMQGGASRERAKWFFTPDASPGTGVTHPYLCAAELSPDIWALIASNLAEGEQALFQCKTAEPNCFGVHEDGLRLFTSWVQAVRISPTSAVSTRARCRPITVSWSSTDDASTTSPTSRSPVFFHPARTNTSISTTPLADIAIKPRFER